MVTEVGDFIAALKAPLRPLDAPAAPADDR
jgi:hypothetical protein